MNFMKVKQIAIEFMVEAARNAYPNEFVGLLRAEDNVITEVLLFPGSKFEHNYSTLAMHMVPIDLSIVGSVHSHPGNVIPSRADLKFFSEHGKIHIIVGTREIKAFDREGNPIQLEIIK